MPRIAAILILVLFLVTLLNACAPDERHDQLTDLARWEDRRLAPADSLTSLIQGPDPTVRKAALRTAGLIGRTEVLPAMTAALLDRSIAVRCQAAFSLGLLGRDVAVEPLTQALTDPHLKVRVAACEGLAHQDHDGSMLYLPALQGEAKESVAAWTALRNVAGQADHDSLVAAIRTGLARPENEVIWRVLRCAELAPDSSLIEVIAPLATHGEVQIRVHALRALSRNEGAEAVEAVLRSGERHGRLKGNDRRRVEIAELRALGRLAGPILGADEDGGQSSLAGRCTALLLQGARNTDSPVTETALAAMAQAVADIAIPSEAAQQESLLPVWRIRMERIALGLLPAATPSVRAAAYQALGALRGRGAMDQLVGGLTDPDAAVTEAALTSLMELSPDHGDVCRWMPTVLEHHGVRGQAAILTALPRLVTALRDAGRLDAPPTSFPRADDPDCLPSVVWWQGANGLASEDFVVQSLAAPLLAQFPGGPSLRTLVAAWNDIPDVQLAILQALETMLSDTLVFSPRCPECVFFESTPQAAMTALDSQAPADIQSDDRQETAALLRRAMNDPDIRIRLAARQTARSTGLLEDRLIPAPASLRETLPAVQRSAEQPVLSLPFEGPEVRCITTKGTFTIRLDARRAPNTCATFLDLVESGFHDDLTFHRVVPDFVIQGGCPRGDGWGGPSWTIRSEWSRQPFKRGMVGIAHSGKDSGGSQWFVCHSHQPHLNGRYTVFGEVTSGMNVVDRIERGDTYRMEMVSP